MAIFYLRTFIIKGSRSAVASSAYMSGQKLYNERLGKTFSYRRKEEVKHAEIILPRGAPEKYKDRQTLWCDVEKKQNKSNSRYARAMIVALPNELSGEQCIELARNFIQQEIVEKCSCAVDWAYHEKQGNKHLHLMITQAFNPDGTWAQMEKKAYLLDELGNKVPELDENGNQKVRVRVRNGRTSTERLWKRVTVQANQMNSKQFLRELKMSWAEHCNKYLAPENWIDGRSYKERMLNRVPMLHEGYEAREVLLKKGVKFDVIKDNEERKVLNQKLEQLEHFIMESKEELKNLKNKLEKWRAENGQERSTGKDRDFTGDGEIGRRLSSTLTGSNNGIGEERIKSEAKELNKRRKKIGRRR